METSPHGIIECDLDGTITFSAPASDRLLGYAAGELIGVKAWEVIHPAETQIQVREMLAQAADSTKLSGNWTGWNRAKDGRVIPVEIDWRRKLDDDGRATGYVVFVTDLSEQRRAEQSLHRADDWPRSARWRPGSPMKSTTPWAPLPCMPRSP